MATSTFLALALAAGTVEGTSVLRHQAAGLRNGRRSDEEETGVNDDDDEQQATTTLNHHEHHAAGGGGAGPVARLVVPSILYGFASVPLGLIGGSPGPVLVGTLSRMAGIGDTQSGTKPKSSGGGAVGSSDGSDADDEEEGLWQRRLAGEMSSTLPMSSPSSSSLPSGIGAVGDEISRSSSSVSSTAGRLPKRRMKLLVTPTSSLSPDDDDDDDDNDAVLSDGAAPSSSADGGAEAPVAAAASIGSNTNVAAATATATATAQRMREENRRALEALRSSSSSQSSSTSLSSSKHRSFDGPRIRSTSAAASAVAEGSSSFLTRYVSTLQSGLGGGSTTGGAAALPTPVAEAMRRSRTVLVGAALASAAVATCAQLDDDRRTEERARRWDRYWGRDAEWVGRYIAAGGGGVERDETDGGGGGGGGGVAIRLIDGRTTDWDVRVERLTGVHHRRRRRTITASGGDGERVVTASKNVLPVVIGDSTVSAGSAAAAARGASFASPHVGNGRDLVYWRMGGSSSADGGITMLPLSAGWLLKPPSPEQAKELQREGKGEGRRDDQDEDEGTTRRDLVRPLLVVEADVSEPLSECLALRYASNDGPSSNASTFHPGGGRLTADRVRIASRMVEAAAVGRGVLPPPPPPPHTASGESQDELGCNMAEAAAEAALVTRAEIVTVCIASVDDGQRGDFSNVEGPDAGQTLVVNSMGGIAEAIIGALETAVAHCSLSNADEDVAAAGEMARSESTESMEDEEVRLQDPVAKTSSFTSPEEPQEDDRSLQASSSTQPQMPCSSPANPLLLVDAIGKGIRYTLRATVGTVAWFVTLGGVFGRSRSIAAMASDGRADDRRKVLHLLADGATERWLRQQGALESSDWQMVTHGVELTTPFLDDEDNERCVVFACCGSDDATCDVACSVLRARPDLVRDGRVVVLLQDRSASDALEVMSRELLRSSSVCDSAEVMSWPGIHTLCVETIHEDLFENARALLADGKSPAQVQAFVDERFSQ